MLQIPEQIPHLNDPMLMQMNNMISPGNIPPMLQNHQNLPMNPGMSMGIPPMQNGIQSEDTSKILLIYNLIYYYRKT